MHRKIRAGEIVVKGGAQAMADGRWGARCCVTDHHGGSSTDHLLEGDVFDNQQEAITSGIHLGIQWVNEKYPLPN